MKIGIIGGGLQGIELCYLCKVAGHDVILADRRPDVPASGLADRFVQLDAEDDTSFGAHLAGVDMIIPAFESHHGLAQLSHWARSRCVDLVYDAQAYRISASKLNSDLFFRDCGIPRPAAWPECRFPVIAKPDTGSGSRGIHILPNENEMWNVIGKDPVSAGWIVEEFINGPTFSVEVTRQGGNAVAHQVTDLHMDARYDCKRVTAPSILDKKLQEEFKALAIRLADQLNLEGVMDVEVVLNQDQLYVLEIDARFPSQTPIAVFHSSGVNLAATLIAEKKGIDSTHRSNALSRQRAVVLEHIAVSPSGLKMSGEHVIAMAGPLSHQYDFFGADEALTDWQLGAPSWVATLICTGSNPEDAWHRREQALHAICKQSRIDQILDPEPQSIEKR